MSLRSTNPIRITSGQGYDAPSSSLTDQMTRRLLSPNSIGITQTSVGTGPDPQAWEQHSSQSYFVTRAGRAQRIEDAPRAGNVNRPQFRSKVVCVLECKHCTTEVCKRGMKAILLADINVELFSTDSPPFGIL
jgi:FAM72 protein